MIDPAALDAILPCQGIAEIRFGWRTNELIECLGTAFEESTFESHHDIRYPDLALEFAFWEDFEGKLGTILTRRPTATLINQAVMGAGKDSVLSLIDAQPGWTVNDRGGCRFDDGRVVEWIDADPGQMAFWFTDDVLDAVDWGPAWIDENTPRWPVD